MKPRIRKDESMLKMTTNSPEETQDLGYKIGCMLKPGDIVCLVGDLGAGKTTMTQWIAKGLGVDDYVTSPTFALINEYNGRYPVYHFDVYRINDIEEMYDLGYEEYFYSEGVTIVEWANIITELLPKDKVYIEITRGNDGDERHISIDGSGETYEEVIKELSK